MSPAQLHQALEVGLAHHQAGRFTEAEHLYRQVLGIDPGNASALALLGALAHQLGHHTDAVHLMEQAIAINPTVPHFHNNLGNALHRLHRYEAAITAYRRALAITPAAPEIHVNLGAALCGLGAYDEAITAYDEALRLRPDYSDAFTNLGNVLRKAGRLDEAYRACTLALQLDPSSPVANNNLGAVHLDAGRWVEAERVLREAIRLKPDYPEAFNNLGTVFKEQGRFQEAVESFATALRYQPNDAQTLNNYGAALDQLGDADAALDAFRRALRLDPSLAETHSNLAGILKEQGRLDEAVEAFATAVRLSPQDARLHSNLILAMLYQPGISQDELRRETARWDERHGLPRRAEIEPHRNDPDPSRRLRIGYVSPDFSDHVVGRNIWPLFRHRDRGACEIFCYSAVRLEDAASVAFRSMADHWRNLQGQADSTISAQIRADGIDVLVDLSLHSAHNRLPIFALQPAPVQVSFAGYPGATGLRTIAYHLTDHELEPAGHFRADSTPIRLSTFWCYDPRDTAIDVSPLPTAECGRVTFGCLNNFCKITRAAIPLWAEILRRVPNSRLLVSSRRGRHREEFIDALGVSADRVEILDPCPRLDYLARYRSIDIALDTFPYNGHTTSLDALWMGVPVVTMDGEPIVSRAGRSQLTNLALPELIAHSPEEYVARAVALASDQPRLAALRATLRARMENSVLMDGRRFAREVENAYREMWKNWCARASAI